MQKYEIWLQLVRQEITIAAAANAHQVDRSTIMRIRTVAEECALAALATSKPGVTDNWPAAGDAGRDNDTARPFWTINGRGTLII